MTILIQGMRRSGTTILYDALLEDPGLRCFYEPLRENTETPGGGSDARETDPFAETKALRESYAAANHPEIPIEEFNWGGPREGALEIGPELPDHCTGFLADLLARGDGREVMIKETRFYDKLERVAPLAPDAAFVHVVRDPRAVAASMMMGRGRKRAADYERPDAFFEEDAKRKLWSSREISQALLRRPEYAQIRKPANFLRILMVWKHTFESTYRDGRRLYGDRYVLLRNEELRADPVAAIARVYETAGRPTPPEVADWARGKVKPPEVPFAANDPRWGEAFGALDMREALANAGYPALAESAGESAGAAGNGGLLGRARARLRSNRSAM
jgi:hypothetical protein